MLLGNSSKRGEDSSTAAYSLKKWNFFMRVTALMKVWYPLQRSGIWNKESNKITQVFFFFFSNEITSNFRKKQKGLQQN